MRRARGAPLRVILRGSRLVRREDATSAPASAAGTGEGRWGPGRGGRVGSGLPQARADAFTGAETASLLARRPYDLRHAAVSTWLNAGVPAPQVAEWAGHSVSVLLRVYAKCVTGQQEDAKRRIEAATRPSATGR
jgi:integrase